MLFRINEGLHKFTVRERLSTKQSHPKLIYPEKKTETFVCMYIIYNMCK